MAVHAGLPLLLQRAKHFVTLPLFGTNFPFDDAIRSFPAMKIKALAVNLHRVLETTRVESHIIFIVGLPLKGFIVSII